MEFLTENDIKHAALSFLKSHYKYRPRIGDSQARLDNISKSGIIADGLLTFQTDIATKFEATFEATSYGKAHEVKYKIKESRLWWDSVTFGTILVTIIFAIIHIREMIFIGPEGIVLTILFLFLSIFFFTMTYRLIFKSFSSYRQIYALEQFKLYDADEQWVAVGIDVFENPEDKYLKELKRQCVLGGFGLIIVEKDSEIRQSITPAQIPVEGKKRSVAKFEALAASGTAGTSNTFKNYTDSFTSSLGWQKENRFKYNFTFQLIILAICAILMGLMLWKESGKTKENVMDNSAYRNKIKNQESEPGEGGYYIIDEDAVVEYDQEVDEYDMDDLKFYDEEEVAKWYNKYHQDSLYRLLNNEGMSSDEILDSLNRILARDSFKAYTNPIKPVPEKPARIKKRGMDPICKGYVNWYGKRYVLKDGVYKSKKTAEYRVRQINKASAMAGILRGGCFKETRPYYIVYVDVVYTNEDKAKSWLPYFDELLKNKGYSSGDLEMISVTVKR